MVYLKPPDVVNMWMLYKAVNSGSRSDRHSLRND